MQRLGRELRFEDERPQPLEPLTQRRDRLALHSVDRPELTTQTCHPDIGTWVLLNGRDTERVTLSEDHPRDGLR